MAQPTREEAVGILEDGHAQANDLLSGLSDDQLTRPATIGDGDWSARDLIGHLAAWEEVALRSLDEFRRGDAPWVESDVFGESTTEAVDAFNARAVADNQRLSLEEVRSRADQAHRELLEAIRGLTDEEWTAKATYPTEGNRRRRLVTMLGAVLGAPQRPFGHAFGHLPDLRAYVESIIPVPDGPGSGSSA